MPFGIFIYQISENWYICLCLVVKIFSWYIFGLFLEVGNKVVEFLFVLFFWFLNEQTVVIVFDALLSQKYKPPQFRGLTTYKTSSYSVDGRFDLVMLYSSA